jgi:hypothetical protein
MPAPVPTKIKSPLRYCLSCAATLVCWALWLALGAGLGAQLYIALVREVPVPGYVLRRIEGQLAAANLEVTFGRARFEPSGRLLLEDVRLRSRLFDDPLLLSRSVYVRKSLWSVLAGRPLPDEIRLEGATLQLPAILSPSGAAEPLFRDFAGALHYENGAWQVTQLAGHVGPVRLTVHGEFSAERRPGTATVTLEEMTTRFLKAGRRLALSLPPLEAFEEPALDVHLVASGPGVTQVGLRLTGRSAHAPGGQPLDLGAFTVTGDWLWTDRQPRPLRLHGSIDRLESAGRVDAEAVRLQAEVQPEPDLSALRETRLHLAARRLSSLGEQVDYPVLEAALSLHDRRLRSTAALITHGELLGLRARADLARTTAELDFEGRVPPALVTGLLTRYGPKLEPYFRFGDPVTVQGTATFGPGWRFDRLGTQVRGGRLDSHGVPVTLARGRIDADAEGNFLAHDALAAIGENYARGSYWMNFRTRAYRMLLVGQLRPPEISGWFRGDWWPEFWKSFGFPVAPPQADVDVQGNWRDPSRTSYYGSTEAVGPVVLGADFERASTVIFVRPQFDHVLSLHATRAGGAEQVDGWFKRFADPVTHRTLTLEYEGAGNPAPVLYGRLGGAKVAPLLAPWQFPSPPRVKVKGRTEFTAAGLPVHRLQFEGKADAGVQYRGFTIDSLAMAGGLSGEDMRLDRVDFGVAGGKGTAKAAIGGPAGARWVGFDAYLKEADLARTILALEQVTAARAGRSASTLTDSRFIKRARGGKLDLAVSGQADPSDLAALKGTGNVQITGAELGEIHLFGLLSQVLSAVWLNFSSLKLDSARSSFAIADGRVHFPDVKITGPSAVIDAKGDFLIVPKTLDFTARLKPYEESRNPITAVVGIVINPLTSIFELKLSGPIAKPNWSVSLGGGGTNGGPDKPAAPATPPATARAAVSPAPKPDGKP